MFLGHIGVALAAKPAAPKASLGVLLIAVTLLDILCGIFMLTGVERVGADLSSSIPWSHGLFMSVVWSTAVLAVAFLLSRDFRTAGVIGLLVFSHWALDFISHPMGMGRSLPPDLPLLFDPSPKVGLGLYNSMVAALVTELGLLAGGITIYLLRTKAKDRTGTRAFWLLPVFLASMALSMLLPSQLALLPTFAVVLLLPIGAWVDRHRSSVS